MYVRMYVCMYLCMYVFCTYACMHACTDVCDSTDAILQPNVAMQLGSVEAACSTASVAAQQADRDISARFLSTMAALCPYAAGSGLMPNSDSLPLISTLVDCSTIRVTSFGRSRQEQHKPGQLSTFVRSRSLLRPTSPGPTRRSFSTAWLLLRCFTALARGPHPRKSASKSSLARFGAWRAKCGVLSTHVHRHGTSAPVTSFRSSGCQVTKCGPTCTSIACATCYLLSASFCAPQNYGRSPIGKVHGCRPPLTRCADSGTKSIGAASTPTRKQPGTSGGMRRCRALVAGRPDDDAPNAVPSNKNVGMLLCSDTRAFICVSYSLLGLPFPLPY